MYWSYILIYTDNLLIVDHEPKVAMDCYLASHYTLKPPGSVKEPDSYLGAQVSKFYIDGADDPAKKPQWAMSSEKYVKQAVADVETELEKIDQILSMHVTTTPVSQGYRPELDQSRELDAKREQYYYQKSLIGVLRWICELGRIDVLVAGCLDALTLRCIASRGSLATGVSYLRILEAPQAIQNGIRRHRAGIQRKLIQDLRLV
jgi:hypothetical protein